MKRKLVTCFAISASSLTLLALAAQQTSPYLGQETRDIKALSSDDVNAYLAGKGMGFAKAAELNGFPGPAHVLELATPLALTPDQRSRTEALFASMQALAKELGRALIEEERKLDRLFATKTVTVEALNRTLGEIGSLQAKVRAAHLEAHLAQAQILSPEQNARYAELRGYGDTDGHSGHDRHHRD